MKSINIKEKRNTIVLAKTKSSLSALRAFTLVELLVVMTIIATLASIAFPVYQKMIERGQATKAVAHAKQVVLACWAYASDNRQKFPGKSGDSTSNDALLRLIPNYSPSEEIFSVDNCDVAAAAGLDAGTADNDFSEDAKKLEAGECHWAYVSGMDLGGSQILPVIWDASGTGGTPTYKEKTEGGVGSRWDGQFAILGFSDTSARKINLNPDFTVPAPSTEEAETDGFSVEPWSTINTSNSLTVLEPKS